MSVIGAWGLQGALLIAAVVLALTFPDNGYYQGDLFYEQQQAQFDTALAKLEKGPEWVSEWPQTSIKLGQVSGVTVDEVGRVLVFHRAGHSWGPDTFGEHNEYRDVDGPPIEEHTVLVFNSSGVLLQSWGHNLFYMPHGVAVGVGGDVWLTDVALHQVFRFSKEDRAVPALVLGERFVPGDDDAHFCKPTSVAVTRGGDFFVADGYCNARILKFAPDGSLLLQWGRRGGEAPFSFRVPHSLSLDEATGTLYVADRERGRVVAFGSANGTLLTSYRGWLLGARVFAVAASGDRLYVVNGPLGGAPVRGYMLDARSGRVLSSFSPPAGLHNPHDVAVDATGALYVAELDPHRVYKFVPRAPVSVPGRWWHVSGRAAVCGAGGTLTVLLVLLVVLRARTRDGARGRGQSGQFKLRGGGLLERRGRGFSRLTTTDDSDDDPEYHHPAGTTTA